MSLFKLDTSHWYIVRLSFLLAGSLILASTALAFFVNPLFLILVVFVAVMLIGFSLTGYCPGALIMDALGISRS